ncbi:MAG: ABC transporter substrate-binding protein [Phycisphaeraceae bacterium]|nr:ABC transporter substrate-binding protein [Phycisphaeraceae bacterium]
MDNRFGLKDWIVCLLLVAILITLWFKMIQDDRQWDKLSKIQTTLDAQGDELTQLANKLASGVHVTTTTQTGKTNLDADGPFARILAPMNEPDYATGDWVIYPFGSTVSKLTPLISSDVYQRVLEDHVMESLANRDPMTLEWQPMLAKRWTISDDGLTIVFKLRDNVTFSDGKPFTSEDVVFSFDWIMNPKVAAPRDRAYYDKVESVTANGPYEVTFKLKETYFKGFDVCAGITILAKHFYGQFTEAQFNESTGLLFGTGPYKLADNPLDWKPGEGKIELVRNDKYWGVAPAIDRIVYREILDDNARLVAFRNGELDRYGPTPEQYVALKEDEQLLKEKQLFEFETITGGYRYIAWNQMQEGKPTIFADKRVRQAMTMLTNRAQMSKNLMVGLATPCSGPFHRLGKQANPDVELWPYAPDKAKALLKEAGFEDRDGDGVIESADGKKFTFKLIYPASSENYKQMAFYLKDAYARAGIAMEPDPLEWSIMIQRIGQRQFDAMTLGWSGTIEGDPNQIFHSDQVADGGDNYIHYINKDLDKLIDEARITMDEDKRMALWHKVHAILHEDQPYTFLWTTKAVLFMDKRVKNVLRVKTGINDVEEWYVPRKLQRWGL